MEDRRRAWYEIFAKARLEKTHRILLRLDDAKREVRRWNSPRPSSGEPACRASRSRPKSSGPHPCQQVIRHAYAFTGVNPLAYGEVYNYRFDVSEMKDPIVTTITAGGWSWVPVTTGKGLGPGTSD